MLTREEEEVDDSGLKRYAKIVAFGTPFSVTTPLRMQREAKCKLFQ